MARIKMSPLLFLSPKLRKRARRELDEMIKNHQKFAKLMRKMAKQMLEGAKRDNHPKR